MGAIHIMRYLAFGFSLVFSIIVLGLASHLTWLTITFYGQYFVFAAMGIATGALTFIVVPIMLIFGMCSKNSFPTKVAFELTALGILWILWIATGALGADAYQAFFGGSCGFLLEETEMACKETSAILAFSFLSWLVLMGYTIVLLIFAIIGSVRGRRTFTSSVMTANFLGPKEEHEHNGHIGDDKQSYNPSTMAPQFTGQTNGTQYSQGGAPPHMPYAPQQQHGGYSPQQQGGYAPQQQYHNNGSYPPSANGGHPGVPQV